jgi:hypothetical protein
MSAADGSVIISTKIDTDGVDKGTEKIKDKLGGLGDESESTGEKIGGGLANGFKKLGAVLASAAIIDKLVDFGKQAVNLGSDLEEVQNVVDVTFTTMSDSVNQFAKDAAKTAGLSETMAKRYVGTFGAMADSFGFAEAEAYEMSTTLTQLSGDVASFYNITQDEAMTKLKGVFTGETEALKELGVVMTQSALDAYALANGFDKTTSAMTEQEKVALRYQFVMDQLSSASGDFVRTSDSWANQTRVLQLQFESLSATIGQGLIGVLSPAIQFINSTVMPALQKMADGFAEAFAQRDSDKLEESLGNLGKSVSNAADAFAGSSKEIETNALVAKKAVSRLQELEKAGLDTAEAQAEYANNVRLLNEMYPDLNLLTYESTGLLRRSTDAILAEIDAMKQKALHVAMEERYTASLRAQAEATLAVKDAEYSRTGIMAQRQALEEQLVATTGLSADALVEMYQNQVLVNSAMQSNAESVGGLIANMYLAGESIGILSEAELKAVEQLLALRSEETALNETIEDGNAAISEQEKELQDWAKAMGIATDEQGDLSKAADSTAESVGKLTDEYEAAEAAARQSIESQIGYFDKLATESDMTASEIVANWQAQRDAINNYNDNLRKAVDMGLAPELVHQLADGSKESIMYLNELVNSTDTGVYEINAAFEEMVQSKETVAETMAAVTQEMSDQLGQMASDVESNLGDIKGTFRSELGEIQGMIDGLTGKTIYIDIVERASSSGGGKPNLPDLPSEASAANIPYLASGAVIPPNAPFAAVLGDQKHGTNLEAPEDLIRKIVREESGAGGTEQLAQLLETLITTVQNIEVGDTVIGEAASRYTSRQKIIHGGGTI